MTPEQKKQLTEIEDRKAELRSQYGRIKDEAAVADLLKWLDASAKKSHELAAEETSDLAKRSNYLQSSLTYATVSAYLRDKFSDDMNPAN